MTDPQRYALWRRTHPPIMGADDTATIEVEHPTENLVRAIMPGVEIRAETNDDGTEGTTLFGHFSRFDSWTKIDSFIEGRFLERISPGAFKKTLREGRPKILLNHGMDPQLGDRVIATPTVLREDDDGAYYEARLLPGIDPLLLAGLRAGEYGASFRFSVVRESWDDNPGRSDHNPDGYPERTLKEVRCQEFGPVTFPAYADATAGIRSMTDEVMIGRAVADPSRLSDYLDYLRHRDEHQSRTGIVVPRDATAARATVTEDAGACSDAEPWAVKDADGKVLSCHATQKEAQSAADGGDTGMNSAGASGEQRELTVGAVRITVTGATDDLVAAIRAAAESSTAVTADDQGQKNNAPAEDRAETSTKDAHPADARRATQGQPDYLYGLPQIDRKDWLL
jgi:HK97 family phage prohead protease